MESYTTIYNDRSDERGFSKLLGVFLNEGWIIDGITINGNTTNDGSKYSISLKRTVR